MEIYFTDITNITDKYIDIIKKDYENNSYAVEDNCYNLTIDLRNEIHKRLIEKFNEMIDFEEEYSGELEGFDLKESFRQLINEL